MKKIISTFLALMLLMTAIPVFAEDTLTVIFDDVSTEIYIHGVAMKSGDYLENGKSETQTTKPAGGYAYYKDGILTLDNFSYEGPGGYRFDNGTSTIIYGGSAPLAIHIYGTNYLKHNFLGYCISSDGDITISGTGTLKINNDFSGIYLRGNGNLTINSGTFELDTIRGSGLSSYNGNITINGGNISARNNGIHYEDYYYWAISHGTGSLHIAEGITVKASVDPNGDLGIFDIANIKTYDYVVMIDERDYSDIISGDIDLNGIVNGIDSNLLKRIIAGDMTYDPDTKEGMALDVNGDGLVNAIDSNLLKRIIAGAVTYAPCTK